MFFNNYYGGPEADIPLSNIIIMIINDYRLSRNKDECDGQEGAEVYKLYVAIFLLEGTI